MPVFQKQFPQPCASRDTHLAVETAPRGMRFGAGAARLIRKGAFGRMVALIPPDVESIPIREAIGRMKTVPLDNDIIESARAIGICFGD